MGKVDEKIFQFFTAELKNLRVEVEELRGEVEIIKSDKQENQGRMIEFTFRNLKP